MARRTRQYEYEQATSADQTEQYDEGYASSRAPAYDEENARERFGGVNLGAVFFGWLVAVALSILLTSIVGAIVAAFTSTAAVSQSDAQRQAGSIGVLAAVVLACVLLLGYYAGGYVAGRMSRFDGSRQGLGVWVLGLFVTIIAIVLGAVFGTKYNILDRVDLPRVPISSDQLTTGGVITAIVVLVVTLIGAIAGGMMGQRYHRRVDRALGTPV